MASAAPAGALARQRLEELGLAVAGDAGDGDDLAGAHLERDLAQRDAVKATGSSDRRSSVRRTAPSLSAARVWTEATSPPTIMRARLAAVSLRGSQVATPLPWRRIVAVWQSRFTSSRRCEM